MKNEQENLDVKVTFKNRHGKQNKMRCIFEKKRFRD